MEPLAEFLGVVEVNSAVKAVPHIQICGSPRGPAPDMMILEGVRIRVPTPIYCVRQLALQPSG